MIKINLLPVPRAKKGGSGQLDLRLELLGAGAILLFSVVGCFYYSSTLDAEIEAKTQEKADKDKQLTALKEKIKKVEDFEQKKKLLEDKNRTIDQLEKARGGPVRVMDFVSQSLDPLKLWLVSMSIKGNEVELEGRAITNDDVVEFVTNLRRTDFFSTIRLAETRSATEGKEGKTGLFQFKLNLSVKG